MKIVVFTAGRHGVNLVESGTDELQFGRLNPIPIIAIPPRGTLVLLYVMQLGHRRVPQLTTHNATLLEQSM